jgi:hypothetical protein
MSAPNSPLSTLMAMASQNLMSTSTRGAPSQAGSILKKGGGGPASMIGHALSGTQLGAADNLIRKAQDRFTMFADGGEVKKAAGSSAKERREIRNMIERGKGDAVDALQSMRHALTQSEPALLPTSDAATKLQKLTAHQGDGARSSEHAASLYREYVSLLQQLDDPSDGAQVSRITDRISQLENELSSLGINLDETMNV